MSFLRCLLGGFLLAIVLSVSNGDPLVPALCIFGDSVVDVGNNNNLSTLIKANFPPYGRDFVTHRPTGRFCNGKLATDFTAEYLGFTSYPPAYLSREARGQRILTGVNFASAASGYYNVTARLFCALTLPHQLKYYRLWQRKIVNLVGRTQATNIFSGGIHLINAGSSDFIQNYYINPLLNRHYSPDEFSDILMQSYSSFVQDKGGCGYFKWIDPSLEVELLKEKLKEVEEERDTLKYKMKELGGKYDSLKQKLKEIKEERDCAKAKFKRLVVVILCFLLAKIIFE
ncbi:GDSL esterase/lipase At5g22810-like [Lycium barbarum]|uniref:GDSL esterase/lipase At5g22810-like n=1 Tax=Lycium barbarum TaxID=112863 RepID=UPI00293F2856|nr:GDSL esterase/lipase At5g22810-like [Lycium barbarum]